MPSYLDLGVLGVVFVSALLSMMRGFTREVLAIASWGAAAAAAYYFYPDVLPHLDPYIHKPAVAQAVAAAIVFFVTLVIVSLFTVRVSDAILDSKIGALDRSLGFLFGAARGFLLAVVAFAIFNWLVGDKQQPEWVRNAKTRPALVETADRVIAMLPEDAATTVETWIKTKSAAAVNEDPHDEAKPVDAAPAAAPAPAPALRKTDAVAPAAADKQKLDALINSKVPLPAPAPPAAFPTPAKP
jgi:membrane protein required for colicin V production